jgi:phosphoribosylanthranilate isomerase
MTVVKICGLRDARSAITAAANGADYLGFIFAPSKRQVGAEHVAGILRAVRAEGHSTPAVGVFVDPDPQQLRDAVRTSGIDLVQFSGEESPETIDQIGVPVIKAIPAGTDDTEEELAGLILQWSRAAMFLLDAKDPTARGGTGKRANWDLAKKIAASTPILLAGGLDPDNVADAIAQVRPHGVDVASGVETDGIKDQEKIVQFIRRAKATT